MIVRVLFIVESFKASFVEGADYVCNSSFPPFLNKSARKRSLLGGPSSSSSFSTDFGGSEEGVSGATTRIVGGQNANQHVPWQVSLQSGNAHFCGGTILDETTVITAAHCFDSEISSGEEVIGVNNSNYWIRAGSLDHRSGGQRIQVASIRANLQQKYIPGKLLNDYAILKLKTPLTLGGDAQPACLPEGATYRPEPSYGNGEGKACYVSGWGTPHFGGSGTQTLKHAKVPLVSNSYCERRYGRIYDAELCAGKREGGADACQGDSGGPLVCEEGGKPILVGVVSYGHGCGNRLTPGLYARIAHVLDYVSKNLDGSPKIVKPTHPLPPGAPAFAYGEEEGGEGSIIDLESIIRDVLSWIASRKGNDGGNYDSKKETSPDNNANSTADKPIQRTESRLVFPTSKGLSLRFVLGNFCLFLVVLS